MLMYAHLPFTTSGPHLSTGTLCYVLLATASCMYVIGFNVVSTMWSLAVTHPLRLLFGIVLSSLPVPCLQLQAVEWDIPGQSGSEDASGLGRSLGREVRVEWVDKAAMGVIVSLLCLSVIPLCCAGPLHMERLVVFSAIISSGSRSGICIHLASSVMSSDVMWCHVISCDVIWCHVIICDVMMSMAL